MNGRTVRRGASIRPRRMKVGPLPRQRTGDVNGVGHRFLRGQEFVGCFARYAGARVVVLRPDASWRSEPCCTFLLRPQLRSRPLFTKTGESLDTFYPPANCITPNTITRAMHPIVPESRMGLSAVAVMPARRMCRLGSGPCWRPRRPSDSAPVRRDATLVADRAGGDRSRDQRCGRQADVRRPNATLRRAVRAHRSDDEALPAGTARIRVRRCARWRRCGPGVAAHPKDVRVADRLARTYIDFGRRIGDAHYAGYAEAVIAPWMAQPAPPVALWSRKRRSCSFATSSPPPARC